MNNTLSSFTLSSSELLLSDDECAPRYQVKIEVLKAHHLLTTDTLLGCSDPYVVVSCLETYGRFHTNVAKRTSNPEWNESWSMHVPTITPLTFECAVWDRHVWGADEPIGKCTFVVGGEGNWSGMKSIKLHRVTNSSRERQLIRRNAPWELGTLCVSWSMSTHEMSVADRRVVFTSAVRRMSREISRTMTPLCYLWWWTQWENWIESSGVLAFLMYFVTCWDVAFWIPFWLLLGLGLSYVKTHRQSVTLHDATTLAGVGESDGHNGVSTPQDRVTRRKVIQSVCAVLDVLYIALSLPMPNASTQTVVSAVVAVLFFTRVVDISPFVGMVLVTSFFTIPKFAATEGAWEVVCTLATTLCNRMAVFGKGTLDKASAAAGGTGSSSRYRSVSVVSRRKTLCRFRFEAMVGGTKPTHFMPRLLVEQDLPRYVSQIAGDNALMHHLGSSSGGSPSHRRRAESFCSSPRHRNHKPRGLSMFPAAKSSAALLSKKPTVARVEGLTVPLPPTVQQRCFRCGAGFGMLRRRRTCDTCELGFCKKCVLQRNTTWRCVACCIVQSHCHALTSKSGVEIRLQMSELSQSPTLQPPRSNVPLTLDDLVVVSRLRDALGGDTAVVALRLLQPTPLRGATTMLEIHDALVPLARVGEVVFDTNRFRLNGTLFGWPYVARVVDDDDSHGTKDLAATLNALIRHVR
eukprot:PhM_4_TR17957/c0_g2_i1/m.17132